MIENLDLTSEVATQSSVLRIIEFLKLLSQEMLEGRKKKLSMERSLREKHKLAGTDWANSKYKKIISYLTVLIRKSEETLQKSLALSDKLHGIVAKLQNSDHLWTKTSRVPLLSIENCWVMKDNTLLSEEEISLSKCPSKPHIAVKQRSDQWHLLRKEAFVTGSTRFQASGLDSIKKRNSLFDKVHLCVPEKTPSSEVREAMAYGTVNEINAIATICTKILPVYFPSLHFVEVGI